MTGNVHAQGHQLGHGHSHRHSNGNPSYHVQNILEGVSISALKADISRILILLNGLTASRTEDPGKAGDKDQSDGEQTVNQMESYDESKHDRPGVSEWLDSQLSNNPLSLSDNRIEEILEAIPADMRKDYEAEIGILLQNAYGRGYHKQRQRQRDFAAANAHSSQSGRSRAAMPRADLGFLEHDIDELAELNGMSARSLQEAQAILWTYVNPPGLATRDGFEYRSVVARTFFGDEGPAEVRQEGKHAQWFMDLRERAERELGDEAWLVFAALIELTRFNCVAAAGHDGMGSPRGCSRARQISRLLALDLKTAEAVAGLLKQLPNGPSDSTSFVHRHRTDPRNFAAVRVRFDGEHAVAERRGVNSQMDDLLSKFRIKAIREAGVVRPGEKEEKPLTEGEIRRVEQWRRREWEKAALLPTATAEQQADYDAVIDRIQRSERAILRTLDGEEVRGVGADSSGEKQRDKARQLASWLVRLTNAYETKVYHAPLIAEALANAQRDYIQSGDPAKKRAVSGASLAKKLRMDERKVQRHLLTLALEFEDGRRMLATDLLVYSDRKEKWLPIIEDLLSSPQKLDRLLARYATHPERGPTSKAIFEILVDCPEFAMGQRSLDGTVRVKEISERTVGNYLKEIRESAAAGSRAGEMRA